MNQRLINVCLAPPLLPEMSINGNHIIVVADILRATTTICTAFDQEVARIFPLYDLENALALKKQGYFIAGERNGRKLDFADAGNSPFDLMTSDIKDKTIVFATTNGTQAINLAGTLGKTVIGAFVNLPVLSQWLCSQTENILVLCAGWKNQFSLEDTIFAGALIEELLKDESFIVSGDEAHAALDLWNAAKTDLYGFIKKASHIERLKLVGEGVSIEYCFKVGTSRSIPMLENGYLVNLSE